MFDAFIAALATANLQVCECCECGVLLVVGGREWARITWELGRVLLRGIGFPEELFDRMRGRTRGGFKVLLITVPAFAPRECDGVLLLAVTVFKDVSWFSLDISIAQ